MTVNQKSNWLKLPHTRFPVSTVQSAWIYFHFVCVCVCVAPLPARWQNTKEAHCCITSSLELFKEHAAPQLHANTIIVLVSLFAATTLTFSTFCNSFFSGKRKSADELGPNMVSLLPELELVWFQKKPEVEIWEDFSVFASYVRRSTRLLWCDSCGPHGRSHTSNCLSVTSVGV